MDRRCCGEGMQSSTRAIGLLVPFKSADPDRLAAILAQADALAAARDAAADDALLRPFGEVDPAD